MKPLNRLKAGAAVDEKIKPCPACMAPNRESAWVCAECGASFGSPSALSPMGAATSEAAMWQGILAGRSAKRPPFIRFLVVWIIFVPLLVTSIAAAIEQAYSRDSSLSFVIFWVGVGLSIFSVSCLYRITRDYFRPEIPDKSADQEQAKNQSG